MRQRTLRGSGSRWRPQVELTLLVTRIYSGEDGLIGRTEIEGPRLQVFAVLADGFDLATMALR